MFQNAPHVRQSESVRTMMTDVIIALVPIYVMAFFYYGPRALLLGLSGILFCVVFSAIGALVLHEKISFDLTPAITGLVIPLLMPATVDYFVIAAACAVAIFVVKLPFGGTGNNLFNPAAVGFASAAICWPAKVFSYPAPLQTLEIFGENTAAMAQSPAYSLALGAVPEYEVLDMLLGSVPGPMGATNILVVATCGIFLMVRKTVNWITPVSFLLPYSLLLALFPRIEASSFDSLCYELFSGIAIFGAFFMLSEPVTSPKRDFGKFMAGITSAVAAFLFRYFGELEMGFAYALIIMNVFSPLFDEICEEILHVLRRGGKLKKVFFEKKPKEKTEKEEKLPFVRVLKKKKAEETVAEVTEESTEAEEISEEEITEEPVIEVSFDETSEEELSEEENEEQEEKEPSEDEKTEEEAAV